MTFFEKYEDTQKGVAENARGNGRDLKAIAYGLSAIAAALAMIAHEMAQANVREALK